MVSTTAIRCHYLYRRSPPLFLSTFTIAVATAVGYRCPCHHSLSPFLLAFAISQAVLSLPRFAITAPLTVLYRHPFRRFLPWSPQPPFAVTISIAVRCHCSYRRLLSRSLLQLAIAVHATIRYRRSC